jgi:hypothetical protein
MRNRKRIVIAGVAMAAALVGGGVAWAAWTSSGSGTGSVTSTTSIDSTITPTGTNVDLFPGATTTFTVSVNNPNKYPVKVDSISAGSSNLVNGCVAGSVYSDAVSPAPATVIAPGASGTYTLTVHMIGDASDACKSQTFTLPLTAQLSSAAS